MIYKKGTIGLTLKASRVTNDKTCLLKLNRLQKHLKKEMVKSCGSAIALAANQVTDSVLESCLNCYLYKNTYFINASYIGVHGTEYDHIEGCMSHSGARYLVLRYNSILLTYQTLCDGVLSDLEQVEVSGFAAAVHQHEIDHLNGKCLWDIGRKIN